MERIEEAALAAPWGLVALAACVLVCAGAFKVRKSVRPSTIAWAVPFAAMGAFFAAWCARGLCQIQPSVFCLHQALCAVLGLAVLARDWLTGAVGRMLQKQGSAPLAAAVSWVRDIALLAVAAWFSFLALEVADNPDWSLIETVYVHRGLMVVALALACLYFLGQRRGALCCLVPVVCAIFGLVQVFLDLFKNTALLPSDVMAWKTAAAVSGGYTYTLPTLAEVSIACALVALAALAYIMPLRPGKDAQGARGVRRFVWACVYVACALACAGGVWYNVAMVDYQDDLDVKLGYWDLRNSYHTYGFLVSFVAAVQDLTIDEPQGYSDEAAEQLQESLAKRYDEQIAGSYAKARAQFQKQRPNVIAIMNESYSDLSIFQELHDGYTGTFVTQDLDDAQVRGTLNMSVHGGGTCNSEYEFLAFSSMAFLSSGMYPYQQFDFSRASTVPSTFKDMGYQTWAMHPSYPGNWSREFVYATMGLDTSLFVYDFEGAEEVHGLVSDRATYERALKIIREADEPQFVLDITMQNHSGYDTGTIPKDYMTAYAPDFLDKDQTFELNEYLSCIKASDEAVEYLIDRLSKTDEPVAVVFFGDHQPSMSRDYNDALFADEGELAHKARIAEVPYFVWTNYDTKGAAELDETSSANFLGAQLLEAIGAPLSPYQKALLVLHQQVSAVNTNGFRDAQGTWHDAAEGAAEDHPYHQLQVLHYLNVVRKL